MRPHSNTLGCNNWSSIGINSGVCAKHGNTKGRGRWTYMHMYFIFALMRLLNDRLLDIVLGAWAGYTVLPSCHGECECPEPSDPRGQCEWAGVVMHMEVVVWLLVHHNTNWQRTLVACY